MSKTTDIATIAVVALIGAGGFLIYKNRNEIGNFFGGIGKGVSDFTDGIGKGVGEFTDGIGSWYGETVSNIQQGVDDIGENIGGFFDGVVNGFTETVTGIQSGISGIFGGIGDFLGETVTGIQSGISGIFGGIGDFFSGKREDEGVEVSTSKQIYEAAAKPITEKTYKSVYGDDVKRVIGVDGRDKEDKPKEKIELALSQKDITQALAKNKELKEKGKLLRELLGLE